MSYAWQQMSGPAATVTNANGMVVDVTLPQVDATSTVGFQLTVTVTAGASATDSVSITVMDVSTEPAEKSGSGSSGPLWLIVLAAAGFRRRSGLYSPSMCSEK